VFVVDFRFAFEKGPDWEKRLVLEEASLKFASTEGTRRHLPSFIVKIAKLLHKIFVFCAAINGRFPDATYGRHDE
jgi:hypothetical protein